MDPDCGRMPGSVDSTVSTNWRDRCAPGLLDDAISSARVGLFREGYDIHELNPLYGIAEVYAPSARAPNFACGAADGGQPFELYGPLTGATRMRIDPAEDNDTFYPTLINLVNVAALAPTDEVPVFPTELIDRLFDDIGVERDPEQGTLIIQVLGLNNVRWSGAKFSLGGAVIAYRQGSEWSTSLDSTTGDGMAAVVNVPAGILFGDPISVLHEEANGDSTMRELYAATGAITFVQTSPAGG